MIHFPLILDTLQNWIDPERKENINNIGTIEKILRVKAYYVEQKMRRIQHRIVRSHLIHCIWAPKKNQLPIHFLLI